MNFIIFIPFLYMLILSGSRFFALPKLLAEAVHFVLIQNEPKNQEDFTGIFDPGWRYGSMPLFARAKLTLDGFPEGAIPPDSRRRTGMFTPEILNPA